MNFVNYHVLLNTNHPIIEQYLHNLRATGTSFDRCQRVSKILMTQLEHDRLPNNLPVLIDSTRKTVLFGSNDWELFTYVSP